MLTPRPITPEKFALLPKRPHVFWVFDQQLQMSHNDLNVFDFLIKYYKFVQNIRNFSQISIRTCDKTHFVWNFWKDPIFCVKSHF